MELELFWAPTVNAFILRYIIDSRVRGIGNKINTLGSSVHSYMGHMACISVFEN